MDRQQAQDIIKNTFENHFDKNEFARFIKNLLNKIEEASFTYQGNYFPDAYKQYIKTLERIGKYSDEENSIDILVITLQKETSLERARTMQRNFIAWYLNGSLGGELKDAALVAYVSPNESDWRFSLVKMDYKFEKTKSGKMKVKEEFTPARRWSFLVGANEKSHTAQSRLVNILADDEHPPSLKEIKNAFDIEIVTKEFFREYRGLFLRTKEALDRIVKKDPKIEADFESKGVDTVNFSKKLLGQIVFLYFLQKKGWFGVGRDADWGSGSNHFLRELFKKIHCDYKNFFNDILEPLFYEALRTGEDRKHVDYYYSRFDCKMPFLNGGLFDPIGDYDWIKTVINIPDKLFSNSNKTKEGDTGDGILDIFDRYNFTVKEDEPLEKEVAIDPELLGKAYEKLNAIRPDNYEKFKKALKSDKTGDENKFNKKFGVYYTPREIVHYMCQQSLINYLDSELNKEIISYQDIGKSQTDALGNESKEGQFDLTVEHRSNPSISNEDIETLIHFEEHVSDNEIRVIGEGKETKTYSYKLPESIQKYAKLIDEKLSEITVCDPAVGSGAFPVGMMSEIVRVRKVLSNFIYDEKRTTYELKRQIIEHSLYGVDIDPGAVEIAKLRLWLSLIVDEDNIKNIKPLPNLDYKIVCGNSLTGFPETSMKDLELDSELEKLKTGHFNETNPTNKKNLKRKIDQVLKQLVQSAREYSSNIPDINFEFKIYFSEVFHEKGGFDVVIGNPPYVQLQKDKGRLAKLYNNCGYNTFTSTGDIYCLFYEKANQLLKHRGVTCYITSNKWMRAAYGEKLRDYFIQHTQPLKLIDVGPGVFDAATVDTNILLFANDKMKESFIGCKLQKQIELPLDEFVRNQSLNITRPKEREKWEIYSPSQQRLAQKIEAIGIPLKNWNINIYRGVSTGYNNAFVIDSRKRKELISVNSKNAEIIKPLLRGRDIQRYSAIFANYLVNSNIPIS